jgi:hypothetical protein
MTELMAETTEQAGDIPGLMAKFFLRPLWIAIVNNRLIPECLKEVPIIKRICKERKSVTLSFPLVKRIVTIVRKIGD